MEHLHRLSDVDAGWALGVAGLAVFIIAALCLMAKCKLSLFTRKAKKKMARGASGKKKKDPTAVAEVSSKEGEADVEAVVLPKQVSARQERIINMIDALLGEEVEEGGEDMLHCSLDSIDRLGESLSSFPVQHKK